MKRKVIICMALVTSILSMSLTSVGAKTKTVTQVGTDYLYTGTMTTQTVADKVQGITTAVYHTKKKNDTRLESTLSIAKGTTLSISASSDFTCTVKGIVASLETSIGISTTTSTTTTEQFAYCIYRDDKTGFYRLEKFAPGYKATFKCVRTEKWSGNKKTISDQTRKFMPKKSAKVCYRGKYYKNSPN